MSLTMPGKTPVRWPEYSCSKKFTSDSWRLKHIKLQHPAHRQVAHQKNMAIRSTQRRIQPAQCCEFNPNIDSVEDLNTFPYLEHLQNNAESKSQPPTAPLPQMETYPVAGAMLRDYIAEPWERDAQGCLETNRQNNPNYPFATREEYRYIQCGIRKMHMKT